MYASTTRKNTSNKRRRVFKKTFSFAYSSLLTRCLVTSLKKTHCLIRASEVNFCREKNAARAQEKVAAESLLSKEMFFFKTRLWLRTALLKVSAVAEAVCILDIGVTKYSLRGM